jgi:hypothetical protein
MHFVNDLFITCAPQPKLLASVAIVTVLEGGNQLRPIVFVLSYCQYERRQVILL